MVNQYSPEGTQDKMSHLQSLLNIPSINPKDYLDTEKYSRLDFIRHPQFGQGYVSEVVDENTLKVFFQDGSERILGMRSDKILN